MEKVINTKYELIKIIGIFLTLFTLIITATVFVAEKPSRTEVREIVKESLEKRLDNIEAQLRQINEHLLKSK